MCGMGCCTSNSVCVYTVEPVFVIVVYELIEHVDRVVVFPRVCLLVFKVFSCFNVVIFSDTPAG
jgi:hypothetical protein